MNYIKAKLTVRVSSREKDVWQKVSSRVGEGLNEFVLKAIRLRVQAVESTNGSPWDDLLGSVSTSAPSATNAVVRSAIISKVLFK